MNARQAMRQVVIVLVLLGAVCVSLRSSSRRERQMVPGDTFWRLTYNISFTANKPGSRLHAAFPSDTSHSRILRQELRSAELTTERLRATASETREIGLVAERPGTYRVTAEFDIHLRPRPSWRVAAARANLSAQARADYLRSQKGIQVDHAAVAQTLDRLQGEPLSKAEAVERLFEYCMAEIRSGGREAPADAAAALQQGVASVLGRARAMAALCRGSKVPARLVTGFEIKQGADIRPHVWVEVLTNGQWEPYDPDNGFARELPHNFLPARRDGAAIIRTTEVADLVSTFSLVRIPPPPGIFRSGSRPWDILDLTRLPLEMHEPLAVILLMPLGALVTCIFRTMIGVRTFGTFTPSLLALSFVYADWRTGLLVFGTVMVLGISSRTLLDELKLLVVPRLSVILTLVVLCIVFGVSLLDYYHLTPGAQAVLLPMVILTMTVERFYLTTEEDSVAFALQLLAGTLLVAFCCYLVLRWETVGRIILAYPELHFFTVAALIVIGRYAGYRLTELWRFRDLVQPRQ